MIPDEFVYALRQLAPTVEQLENIGFSANEAVEFIDTYQCYKRKEGIDIDIDDEFLSSLFSGWDLNQLIIGMLEFEDIPFKCEIGVQIGTVETDPLCFDSNSGEIFVSGADSNLTILWHVAKNGNCFFDSLLIAVEYLTKRMLEEIDYDDLELAEKKAMDCSLKAGGDKYLDFYRMLLG